MNRARWQRDYQQYLIGCTACSRTTSRQHARQHDGLCARCADTGTQAGAPTREERILESGYMNYAREEGHYQ